jgi:glycerol kinase
MPQAEYLLVIDNGTQSVRAMVFDQCGEVVAKSKVDIEPYKLAIAVQSLPSPLADAGFPSRTDKGCFHHDPARHGGRVG